MRIKYADKLLQSNVLLYPMRGFYMLHLPLNESIAHFQKALIGEKEIVLMAERTTLVARLNQNVASILAKQVIGGDVKYKPVLGVVIKQYIDECELDDVSFAHYESIEELKKYLSSKQVSAIYKVLGGGRYEVSKIWT